MVGPGKPVDPERHFIVCANVLGSCMGSSGPATINPATSKPWAMSFPVITIRDMVRAQAMLLDHLGVGTLLAVVGGSMGGMQALSWPATFPDRVRSAVVIASTARHTAQNIAFPRSYQRSWPIPVVGTITPPAIHPPPVSPGAGAHHPVGSRLTDSRPHFARGRRAADADLIKSYLRHQDQLRRPLRRQLLSLHHGRGLFRPAEGMAGTSPFRPAKARLPAVNAHRLSPRRCAPSSVPQRRRRTGQLLKPPSPWP